MPGGDARRKGRAQRDKWRTRRPVVMNQRLGASPIAAASCSQWWCVAVPSGFPHTSVDVRHTPADLALLMRAAIPEFITGAASGKTEIANADMPLARFSAQHA